MRAFLIACLAAVVLAVCAAVVLNRVIPNASQTVFSTEGVRI